MYSVRRGWQISAGPVPVGFMWSTCVVVPGNSVHSGSSGIQELQKEEVNKMRDAEDLLHAVGEIALHIFHAWWQSQTN